MVVGIEARAIARAFLKLSHGANHGQNSCQSWQKLDTQPKSATETACSGKYTNPRYGLETRTHARSSSKSCTRTRCFTEADKSVALRNFKVGICLCPHRHKPPPLLLLERSPARVQPGLIRWAFYCIQYLLASDSIGLSRESRLNHDATDRCAFHSPVHIRIFVWRTRMEPKICPCCGEVFQPRPQVQNQTYCSSPACQRERRQAWQRKKLQDDRFYRENRQDAQRAWRERNPDYSMLISRTN